MNLAGHASDNFGQIARRLRSVINEIGGTVLLTTSMLNLARGLACMPLGRPYLEYSFDGQ